MRNPVKRHMHKAVRASVVASKRRSMLLDTTLRDAREDAQNELVEPKTITFESGSEVHWDYSEDCLQGCLNDIGSSSIFIDDTEEDEK